MGRKIRIVGVTLAAAAVAGAAVAWIVRDQVTRHRRNLFSPHALQRLAALSHMSRGRASVSDILLLRDFIAWESRTLLRERAKQLLERMEEEAKTTALDAPRAI
ncbi:MAG: hypothetical protein RQ745_11435 [Longimicrobiales bacterium]|nr:hypothetical protein [Longimicrobiales bacterium]